MNREEREERKKEYSRGEWSRVKKKREQQISISQCYEAFDGAVLLFKLEVKLEFKLELESF